MKYSKWLDKHIPNLNNKKIIITGANSGLGYECCRALLYKGATIIMACRNMVKANIAKDNLIKEFPNSNIYIKELDLSSFNSIENFVSSLNLNDIDILINNAGVYHPKKGSKTQEGIDLTIGTNYFGMYYLNKLIENKKHNNKIKIINVSSITSRYASLNLDEFNDGYAKSKLAIASYTLAKQQEGKYNYYLTHPGISATNIIQNFSSLFQKIGSKFMKIFFHSPQKACLSILAPLSDIKSSDFGPRFLQISGYPKKIKNTRRQIKLSKDIILKTELYLERIKIK